MKYILALILALPLVANAATVPFEHGLQTSHIASKGVSTSHSKVFIEAQAVPVPPAMWLFGSGLVGMVLVGRRRR